MNEFHPLESSKNLYILNQERDVEEKLHKMDKESVKQKSKISFSTIDRSTRVFIAQDLI